jgi:hypothetical protein
MSSLIEYFLPTSESILEFLKYYHFLLFSDSLRTFICIKNYNNYGFIARMIILFVLLHYRNRRYGNADYDNTCRYEIF